MNMYAEQIIDLYKHPINKGRVSNETASWEEHNVVCGDKIIISIDADKIVNVIKFEGEGCAISQAAACLFTDYAKGKTVTEILSMQGEDMIKLLGITVAPARLKCAMLAMSTTKRALEEYNAKHK